MNSTTEQTPQATLVARLTPPGRSALATIVIIGPQTIAVIEALFQTISGRALDVASSGPHYGYLGVDPKDDVVLTLGETANGESQAEIHCHGGPAMVEGLIGQIEAQGAVRADWRAALYRVGKSEIVIEATEALSRCATPRVARILLDQWNGALDREWNLLTGTEGANVARRLLEWERFGQHLVDPWRVLLLGRPNVGKSSLLNAVAGHARAIVHSEAGTTRDVVDAQVAVNGWPIVFTDGAGIRATTDPLERAGIGRMVAEILRSDLRLVVVDGSQPIDKADEYLIRRSADVVAINKTDLGRVCSKDWNIPVFEVSATEGSGVDELLNGIVRKLVPSEPKPGQPIPFTQRQREILHAFANSD